ncbi:MAG: pilus assembly protein PilP [Desulfuromonadaceae bacterium]|nr:pilus assembly protein PilP [Desulfuromonadaceae bacterium]
MISRFHMVVSISIFLTLLASGCGQEAPPVQAPKPTAVRQKVKTPPGKTVETPAAEEAAKEDGKGFVYNPDGKRDPFQSLMEMEKSVRKPSTPETPLQKYALNQLRIIAVVWGKGEPRAMVVAPDGKSHILKRGVKVGQNDGVVTEITREEILIREKIYDFGGTSRIVNQKIPLPITKKELI